MSDDELIAAVIRRWLSDPDPEYFHVSDTDLCLDGTVKVSPDEAAALQRAAPKTYRELFEERWGGPEPH